MIVLILQMTLQQHQQKEIYPSHLIGAVELAIRVLDIHLVVIVLLKFQDLIMQTILMQDYKEVIYIHLPIIVHL